MNNASQSSTVVYAAIAANGAIAIAKFSAAAFTGSSAMLSEGIHSTVDSVNEFLLLVGLRRSRQVADREHPFGHGKELYFWSLIVAIILFGVGAGMAMYEGIVHFLHPQPLRDLKWSLGTLAAAAVFEGISFALAFRGLGLHRQPASPARWWRRVRRSKDPAIFTVFLEDLAALFGVAIAALGILIGYYLQEPRYDAAASMTIGVLLGVVALLLARESLGLLVGESAAATVVDDIFTRIQRVPGVRRAERPLTMQLSPDSFLVNVRLELEPDMDVPTLLATLDRIEQDIRGAHPAARRVVLQPVAGLASDSV